MFWPRAAAALCIVAALTAGCSSLLTAEPTPVPGAAATLTRSIRTPIPTPDRPAASPAASPVASRVAAASPGASPSPARQGVTEDEIAQLQARLARTVSDAALPGVEGMLLDRVSLSTTQGGSIMDNSQAASWLRDRAGPDIKVASVEPSNQTQVVHVVTEGWTNSDPIEQGRVSFSLRRYDVSGRPDEERGDWKIDVIEAE